MRLDIERAFVDEPQRLLDNAYDSRFRRLFFAHEWAALAPAIRARFTKRLAGTDVAVYRGRIVETRLNRAGRILAQAARLIGAPLPLDRTRNQPAVVIVSEDAATGGQRWTRVYHRARGNPQAINSAKAFGGPTGLEEHIGGGFGMALRLSTAPDRIVFASDHYFLRIGPRWMRVPRWLAPGLTTVTHRDLRDGTFMFELDVRHPLFGELVHQTATFSD